MSFSDLVDGTRGYTPAPIYSTNGDTFEASMDMMRTNFNTDSAWRLTGDAYYARNEMIKKRFGRDIVAEIRKEAPEAGADYLIKEVPKRADKLIAEGRMKEPDRWNDIKTNAEVEEGARETARMSRQAFADTVARNPSTGIGKTAAIFGGSIAGGFTDPLNIATMAFGAGPSRSIIKAAMIEGSLNAAAEAAAVPMVKDWQNKLGFQYGFGDAAADVGTAFVGGAALSSLIRGIVPATRAGIHYAGSASRYVMDKVASSERLPQSVRNAASYMSRVAHIDESAPPGSVKTDADLQAHREKAKTTAEDLENYRAPSEDPTIREERLTPETKVAVDKAVEAKLPEVKADVTATVTKEFLDRAEKIKADLKNEVSVDVNKPSSLKKHLGYVPVSLSQFVKKGGGIMESAGELKNRGITHKSMPGLVKKQAEDKGAALMDVGVLPSQSQTHYVKERAFDEGYFPGRNSADEITDSEFWDALANDLKGQKIYREADLEQIAMAGESSRFVDEFDRMGITKDMTTEEIAAVLHDNERMNDVSDIAGTPRPLMQPLIEITVPDSYTVKRAAFDDVLKENPNLKVRLEDGTQITVKQMDELLGGDLNAIEAMTKCRLA